MFDCDGVLLDTTAAWSEAFEAGANAVGHQLLRRDHLRLLGSSVGSAASRIASRAGRSDDAGRVAETMLCVLYEAVHTHPPCILPGVTTLLARLHSRIRLGVASNAPHDILARMLTRSGLHEAFEEVVSADTVAAPKPAPDVYLAACERLGARPAEAIAVEDSRAGAVAAQSAGMSVVVVAPGDWPADAPLDWPAQGRPVLYVTSLVDPVVASYVLAAA